MTDTLFGPEGSFKAAVISDCGQYRYRLSRWWGPGPRVAWLMFNPSTADALKDDATIRKVTGFTEKWGFDGFDVVNLFAFRSTEPRDLRKLKNPLGDENIRHISEVLSAAPLLICAWGCESHLKAMRKATWDMASILVAYREMLPNLHIECLGKSKAGTPYHPLMLPYTTPRIPF